MLLLHQVGSVKIGEVIRYTVTYTPSHDRILPSPEVLHLRIRNTSAIALRAAFVHGPYTLNVSALPAHYDPNRKFENPRRYGVPEFEPMLKAGGTWTCQLLVPDDIRQSAGLGAASGHFGAAPQTPGGEIASASWVIEVASQVIFSSSAAVGYEVLLARDAKSLNLGSTPVVGGQAQVMQPGKVSDFLDLAGNVLDQRHAQPRGIFSRAVTLKVEDTPMLWNTPQVPGLDVCVPRHLWPEHHEHQSTETQARPPSSGSKRNDKVQQETDVPRRKVHLVMITHGLHSNLGADMLYLKESIDATVKQAKLDREARKAEDRENKQAGNDGEADNVAKPDDEGRATVTDTTENGEPETAKPNTAQEEDVVDDDEEVVVRGFSGNATRTERGIKFLGKRLAKFVLSMTYPDQPFLPSYKSKAESFASALIGESNMPDNKPAHKHSSVHLMRHPEEERPFQITSISFIGHSLGGLIQTYAIAYIQKHSPQFFTLIRPVNFIALASPMLGLSNENPMYVRFALDFGLVGRTGQDLGLTWRAPTIARSSWGALVGSLGDSAQKKVLGEPQPESKPLLRILPTGPAHKALKKFRNRTLYSNVVNDGIVPLRTSCLLFLDWQGLGRVEKARREAGLVESMVNFGWAELTGANLTSGKKPGWTDLDDEDENDASPSASSKADPDADLEKQRSRQVPQPATNATIDDDRQSLNLATPYQETNSSHTNSQTNNDGPFAGFFNFFKPNEGSKTPPKSPRQSKIYQRSQTLKMEPPESAASSQSRVTAGHEHYDDDEQGGVSAPPRTSFFESAGDLLNPKLPTIEYLLDPSRRPRTIFHDRVYHPSDIPAPPLKKRPLHATLRRISYSHGLSHQDSANSGSSSPYPPPDPHPTHEDSGLSTQDYDDPANTNPDRDPDDVVDSSNMRVEEKIARAYHKDLSWRKVLVKLEPDAHNNIIVRRMFANANGWPVIKHLVDAHFSDTAAAKTRDEDEPGDERAWAMHRAPDETGAETATQDPPSLRLPRHRQQARAQPRDGGADSAPRTGGPSSGDGVEEIRHRRHLSVPIDGLKPVAFDFSDSHTGSEGSEQEDTVPDLPQHMRTRRVRSRSLSSGGAKDPATLPIYTSFTNSDPSSSTSRPQVDRLDSVTWSDRDWADSADESDLDLHLAYGKVHKVDEPRDRDQDADDDDDDEEKESRGLKSPVWNWTEKIVGKGAATGRKGRIAPLITSNNSSPISPRHAASLPFSGGQQQKNPTGLGITATSPAEGAKSTIAAEIQKATSDGLKPASAASSSSSPPSGK